MTNPAAVSAARPVALITGASAGIGSEFGLQLADRGYDVVLVARRRDRLEALAARIRALPPGVRAEVVVADLAAPGGVESVVTATERLGLRVELLVNNAGFGTHGYFERLSPAREHDEIALNCAAPVALAHAFLPGMLERRRGGVINVASTAAFQPVPYMAVYGATKAFVRSFSEALHEEVRGRGVRVVCLCPGPTATEFFDVASAGATGPVRSAAAVARTGLRTYDLGKPYAIDGTSNRLLIALSNCIPRRWSTIIAGRVMRP